MSQQAVRDAHGPPRVDRSRSTTDDETDLEARDLDLTEIRLRGRARPYEQRDERDEP